MSAPLLRPWVLILAGGGGTRLWPLSRRSQPKQFLPLLEGGETLIGATVRRLHAHVPIERTLVVTSTPQAADVRRCLPTLPEANIVIEPVGRNTAPAIGLSILEVLRRDPYGIVAVLPSDHYVADENRFAETVATALEAAARGAVVTIGIHPTRPETGYGYIKRRAEPVVPGSDIFEVERFVEKPDRPTAERYVTAGEYLWNSGMFFFPAARMLEEIEHHVPELGEILGSIRANPALALTLYPAAPNISIDYGVMEKLPAQNGLQMVPGNFGWNDVGSWATLSEVRSPDAQGNVVLGEAITVDARNNVLVGENKLIAAVGVEDLIIIAAGDAVLVLPRSRAQDVRAIVAELEAAQRDPYL